MRGKRERLDVIKANDSEDKRGKTAVKTKHNIAKRVSESELWRFAYWSEYGRKGHAFD